MLSVNGKRCKLTSVAWTHVWRCIQAGVCVCVYICMSLSGCLPPALSVCLPHFLFFTFLGCPHVYLSKGLHIKTSVRFRCQSKCSCKKKKEPKKIQIPKGIGRLLFIYSLITVSVLNRNFANFWQFYLSQVLPLCLRHLASFIRLKSFSFLNRKTARKTFGTSVQRM